VEYSQTSNEGVPYLKCYHDVLSEIFGAKAPLTINECKIFKGCIFSHVRPFY